MIRLARVRSFFKLCHKAAEPRFAGISCATCAGSTDVA
jgi:hypothetical protein